jgi:hypothetical protein
MSAMTHTNFSAGLLRRWLKWPLLCGLIGLALCRSALATEPLYENDAIVNYPGNVSWPPMIDATNFLNNGEFIINFTTFSMQTEFYETWNTLNYTNYGLMTANTGFQFDDQTTAGPRLMAGSFYNPGTINCASITDTNIAFFFSAGYLVVSATNIANPGTVNLGLDGLMRFTGQNVDLTRSVLNMEGFGLFSNLGVFGLYSTKGIDTNVDWSPSSQLTPSTAAPSLPVSALPPSPAGFGFPNVPMSTTPYFNTAVNNGGSNIIVRAVFLHDPSPNVTHNVYFFDPVFGSGAATIEWIGTYVDAATGATLTNYLYLNDNYLRGDSTNVVLINGVLDNFTFFESPTSLAPFLGPPTASSFPFGIIQPAGVVTNSYAYVDALLAATTVATNSIANGAITNLPARIQIKASRDLNLGLAQITGLNYLSLQATNQFDGSAGALIASPYADINVGVTNGFLTASNVLEASIPNWNGTIQAWSARWAFTTIITNIVGTNISVTTVSNDYRVLIVSSQIAPTTASQVQDLILRGTNSVVISDTFNVMRTLSINAQNLTLTTNGPGNGATSLDGELNLESGNILWASAMPKLRNLTNNGAIRTANLAQFNNATAIITNTTPSTPAVAATGTLSKVGAANVANSDTVTIGSAQYTFVAALNKHSKLNQIIVGATFDGSMSNLIAAINGGPGSGTNYSSGTITSTQVTAGLLTSHAFTVTAIAAGSAGNLIAATTTSANLTWNGPGTLSGGVDYVPGTTNFLSGPAPYDSFINLGLLSNQGGSAIWANNFTSGGTISAGVNNFILQSLTTTLTNGSITAGGDVSITAGNLVASNLVLLAGRSLTLQATNLLTDTGVTNGNFWSVGNPSGTGGNGLALTIKPLTGDLLGTTITNFVPGPNKLVINTWAATNVGASTSGYTNNVAVGHLILDSLGPSSTFQFNGTGVSNALYVDLLELQDQATNRDVNGNFTALNINNNMVIYYASAIMDGASIADKMNHKNGDRLRWIPAYLGYFSSTNFIYPDGTTNILNISLLQSTILDSDGDGIANASDPTPIFTTNQWAVQIIPPTPVNTNTALFTWHSIPSATNVLVSSSNLMPPYSWQVLTNFVSPSPVPPTGGWPITNVVSCHFTNPPPSGSLGVWVYPNSTSLYGP